MTPPIDVVIVNFNTRDDVLACLASVLAAPPVSLGRVFVVDNASADGSVAAIRSAHPSVTVIALDRNLGFGAANNVALRQSTAPLVLLLNSDTIAGAGTIDALAGRLVATGAVAAGPRLVDASGRPEMSFGSMLSPTAEVAQALRVRFGVGVSRRLSRERQVDWVSGACLLLRRESAAAAGFFDERYFLYEEDVDLCAALRAAGGRILFTPAAQIIHRRGRSHADRTHYDRSHLAFYDKHLPSWAPWLRLGSVCSGGKKDLGGRFSHF